MGTRQHKRMRAKLRKQQERFLDKTFVELKEAPLRTRIGQAFALIEGIRWPRVIRFGYVSLVALAVYAVAALFAPESASEELWARAVELAEWLDTMQGEVLATPDSSVVE